VSAFGGGDGVSAAEAHELLAAGSAVALDVREDDEWQAGHIAGALHIPMGELGARLDELPDAGIVAVCRSGSRSGLVTDALRRAGYRVENLRDGMRGWQRAGLPLEPADGWVA
jgi:rhodanese-related sulfurtransferase